MGSAWTSFLLSASKISPDPKFSCSIVQARSVSRGTRTKPDTAFEAGKPSKSICKLSYRRHFRHFQNLSDFGGGARPGIVHRLDKKTSGLLIIAKNNLAHVRLSKDFHDRQIQKTYFALVHGKPARDTGTIELPVGRHPTLRTKMSAGNTQGRPAFSEYRVTEDLRAFSLLEVKIKTGRTHQIRVHLSAIGHPVVGDDVYGERSYKEFTKKFGELKRYFLHAAALRFTHPTTDATLEFHSPLPAELQKLLNRIKS